MALTNPDYKVKDDWHAKNLHVHGDLKVGDNSFSNILENIDDRLNNIENEELPEWDSAYFAPDGKLCEVQFSKEFEMRPHVSIVCIGSGDFRYNLLDVNCKGFKMEFVADVPNMCSFSAIR